VGRGPLIVVDVFTKHMIQVTAAKNKDVIQRFLVDGSHLALRKAFARLLRDLSPFQPSGVLCWCESNSSTAG
jgi:hypothetical protein